jgi:hypothetical protein
MVLCINNQGFIDVGAGLFSQKEEAQMRSTNHPPNGLRCKNPSRPEGNDERIGGAEMQKCRNAERLSVLGKGRQKQRGGGGPNDKGPTK